MPVYLALTQADAPGCPAASAVGRFELDEITNGAWPGLVLVPDDGRALWVPPPPAPPVPASITNYQARALLSRMPSVSGAAGRTLFQDVDDAMHAAGGLDLQAWEYANDVTRDGDLVASLGAKLGMTGPQLDEFFVTASAITA